MKGAQVQQDASHHVSGQSNEPMTRPAHALTSKEVASELQTNASSGLSSAEAASRLVKYGSNDLGEEKRVSALSIFVQQIFNSMTLVCRNYHAHCSKHAKLSQVLVLALAASFAIQAWIEGGVLGGMILLNIIIGFFQDLQAQRTIASLNSLSSASARLIRDGQSETADAATLVPGDIIELKMGDVVPADSRIIE